MELVEWASQSKSSQRENEDLVFLSDEFVAVIDGAGDALKREFKEHSFGVHASVTVAAALEEIEAPSSGREIVDRITDDLRRLNSRLAACGYSAPWPAANFVVYSRSLNSVIRVGDCSFVVDGEVFDAPMKSFEKLLVRIRKFFVEQGQRNGDSRVFVDARVSEAFTPIYRFQEACQNNTDRGTYSFAVLDGSSVPDWGIEVFQLSDTVREVCLLSDGYPIVGDSLDRSERLLFDLLREDPLLIGEYAQSKAPSAGDISFDDRSFVRFRLP